ncbi:MAG: HlyD family efflux transporter periplasmic adaptor subunit [Sphingobacteriaceae bacterium]|nr:HlyD family efflux transporter periplasmic adaptor subunit [Sphingobacteriaceae bacterium]
MKKIINMFAISCFLIASCNHSEEKKAIKKDIKELVFASGELTWDNTYKLTAQTEGVLKQVNFEVGDLVNKDQTLATIDNKTNELNESNTNQQFEIANINQSEKSPFLQQLNQNITYAENKLKQDKMQLERYERLLKNESIAKVEYENMALTMQNSLSQYNALKKQYAQIQQQAKQQYINSKTQLSNNTIVKKYNQIQATEQGTVIEKLKSNGDYVKKGDVIATIANNKQIKILLNIDENNIEKIKLGQTTYIKLNTNKNKVLEGEITEIQSSFDTKTQSFLCTATLKTPLQKSLYGTPLEANILVGEKKNTLLIPRNYLGFGNKVNIKGRKEPSIIKTGIISSDYVEVLSGLNENDIILPIKP